MRPRPVLPSPGTLGFWLAVVVLCVVASCKSGGEPCQREMTACLKRCDATGTDLHPAVSPAPPHDTMTACEKQCQKCRSSAAPAPSGPPTPTGN